MKKKDNKSPQVLAILQEIERINTLIELHKNQDLSELMLPQYQRLKIKFVSELQDLLNNSYAVQFGNQAA